MAKKNDNIPKVQKPSSWVVAALVLMFISLCFTSLPAPVLLLLLLGVVFCIVMAVITLIKKIKAKSNPIETKAANETKPQEESPSVTKEKKTIEFPLAGVELDNSDGENRQKILKRLYKYNKAEEKKTHKNIEDMYFGLTNLSVSSYTKDGKPAIHVYYEDDCVGDVPEDKVDEMLRLMESGCLNHAWSFLDIDFYDNDEGKQIYTADFRVSYTE